jgi:hypothetical protein
MELKDILGFVDIGDVKNVDEFKEKFNSKFAPKSDLDDANKKLSEFTGKHAGSTVTLLKRLAGLENKDIDGKKWEEVAEMAINKFKSQVEELEGKSGQSNEEALKDLNKKIEKLTKERDDYKSAQETLQSTYEKEKLESETKFKGFKIGNLFESAKGKVATKLKDLSPAEKLGFEAALKDIIVDFDEKETPIVKDKEGKRIQNPNKAGSFLGLDEAIELKANELGLIKKNTGGGQPANLFSGNPPTQPPAGGGQPTNTRQLHPNALSHAEKLRANS